MISVIQPEIVRIRAYNNYGLLCFCCSNE